MLPHSGHAPGHLRDAFLDILELKDFTSSETLRLTGLLWNCTDIIPGEYRPFTQLSNDQEEAFTYAQAARRIRRLT